MWAKQRITASDVDYTMWDMKREQFRQFAKLASYCMFTVDVFKGRYDFASDQFVDIFGFNESSIKNIVKEGDVLEDRIHPDDRNSIMDVQIKHSQFIYSLPPEERNNFQTVYQFRMLNRRQQYVNVISRQQVLEADRKGKAWIIMGMMEFSPDQDTVQELKYTVINRKTGVQVNQPAHPHKTKLLTHREQEILHLIHKGLLSKEIAYRLGLSIHTIHNHRKNILAKLQVDNVIEAINKAYPAGLF